MQQLDGMQDTCVPHQSDISSLGSASYDAYSKREQGDSWSTLSSYHLALNFGYLTLPSSSPSCCEREPVDGRSSCVSALKIQVEGGGKYKDTEFVYRHTS